jgi:hypothetical protein
VLTPGAGALITPVDLTASLQVAGSSVLGSTVLRTRFRLATQAIASTDTAPSLFYGIVVWDSTAGSTKPDPSADFDVDWMFHTLIQPATAPCSILDSTTVLYGENIDLKSRRRLHEMHDRPFFVAKNVGTQPSAVQLFAKMLLALP